MVQKLGSGVSVDLYIIGGSVSLSHINSMVNHNSQQCREHKKIHILLHLAEAVGFGDNYNKPECGILHVILHVTTYGFAVFVSEFKLEVSGVGSKSIKSSKHGKNQGTKGALISLTMTITRYDQTNVTMAISRAANLL